MFKRLIAMLVVSTLLASLALLVTERFVSSAPLVTKATTQEVQMILSHHGYSLSIDGDYGPKTETAVRHWQRVNGLKVTGFPTLATMRSLRDSIDGPATTNQPAKRLNPPPSGGLRGLSFAPGGLDACEEMSWYREQAGLPERFDALGWRESNCLNGVTSRTGCCFGYWQNYLSSHLRASYRDGIINQCQVNGVSDIRGDSPLQKQKQACVTAVVYSISGYSPWS